MLESSLEEYGRLSRLTSRMLFLARTENPQSAIAMGPVPMDDLVRDVVDFFEAPAAEKQVILTRSVRGSVRGDRDMLRQALGNLLSNALEATPPGGTIAIKGGIQGRAVGHDRGRQRPRHPRQGPAARAGPVLPGGRPHGRRRPGRRRPGPGPPGAPGPGWGWPSSSPSPASTAGKFPSTSEEGVGTTLTLTFPTPRPGGLRGDR